MRKYLGLAFLILLLWRLPYLGHVVAMNGLHVGLVTAIFNGQATANPGDRQSQTVSSLQARVLAQLDPAQAEFWLQQGVEGNGRSLTYFELCRLYWQEGRREEAITACQEGEIPAIYWVNLGLQAEQAGDQALALVAYETAVAVDPSQAGGWFRLGQAQFHNQSYVASIQSYENAIHQHHPPNPGLYSELGRAYIQVGNIPKAISIFEQGITLFPETQYLFLNIADAYKADNNLIQADEVYKQLLEKWPEDARIWAFRGELALKEKQWEQALSLYEKAVAHDAQNMGYWLGVANAANQIGMIERATHAYEQTLLLASDRVNIWLQAGQFFLAHGNRERAKTVFEHVIQLEPNNQQALEKLEELSP